MTETTIGEQIEIWNQELAVAMTDQQWRRALQLCSWLRYTMDQQERSDPAVEEMHRQAKEALADEISQERAQRVRQRKHRRLRLAAINQSATGTGMQALDSIEAFYQAGASQQEALSLVRELQIRLSDRLAPTHWRRDPKGAALARRFNEVLAQIRSNP